MAAAVSPIKVDGETDQLISHAAHFLGRSKKDLVDEAVRAYVDAHREEINAGIRDAMARLDGTSAGLISVMTGLSRAELDEIGGVPEG